MGLDIEVVGSGYPAAFDLFAILRRRPICRQVPIAAYYRSGQTGGRRSFLHMTGGAVASAS
jgi:hypothetical protein